MFYRILWFSVKHQQESGRCILNHWITRETLDSLLTAYYRSVLSVRWKDWSWSWNSNTLATSCEELTHWKKSWFWEGLKAGGEGDDRGWDGWMASPTRWTWVWVNSESWWWTGRPGMLWFMGLQKVGHDWAIELNWTDLSIICWILSIHISLNPDY